MVSLRQRISFHEAGHATAALVYNIPIIAVSIDADVLHLHRGHYRAPANFAKLPELMDRTKNGAPSTSLGAF
jgi:hypothetical protein